MILLVTCMLFAQACTSESRSTPRGRGGAPTPSTAARVTARTSVHRGITFVERANGRAALTEALPLIVVLHGLGDTPENFLELFQELPLRARIAAARGFDSFGDGYAWMAPTRPVDGEERAPAIRAAAARLEPAIAELASSSPACGTPIVIGFSQGAMLSFALAASEHPVVGAAFPIAGYLPPSLATSHAATRSPHIVALHGTIDHRVSFDDDRHGVEALTRAGLRATLRAYESTDHTVSADMQSDLLMLLRAELRDMGCTP